MDFSKYLADRLVAHLSKGAPEGRVERIAGTNIEGARIYDINFLYAVKMKN